MHVCQMRNRTSGEDLVVLERRELSYRILCATAAMVRYVQLIFFLMCCVTGSMLRTGSSLSPKYMNVSGSFSSVQFSFIFKSDWGPDP